MSENSAIGWTDHTYNAWWGCMKVSPGCQNCYALTFSKRTGHDIWGPPATTPRRFFGEKHWQEPFKWNAAAQAAGERKRVFSASMSDVFEEHPDVGPHRDRLFRTIEATPWLDWQLLTKRPENVNRMIPSGWMTDPPKNWWQGTSVENQDAAEDRINELVSTPAPIHFLSVEPMIGPVNLRPWLWSDSRHTLTSDLLDWVIIGGESGPGHRALSISWVEDLVSECQAASVAVYVKQDSGQYPGRQGRIPDELMLHEFPQSAAAS